MKRRRSVSRNEQANEPSADPPSIGLTAMAGPDRPGLPHGDRRQGRGLVATRTSCPSSSRGQAQVTGLRPPAMASSSGGSSSLSLSTSRSRCSTTPATLLLGAMNSRSILPVTVIGLSVADKASTPRRLPARGRFKQHQAGRAGLRLVHGFGTAASCRRRSSTRTAGAQHDRLQCRGGAGRALALSAILLIMTACLLPGFGRQATTSSSSPASCSWTTSSPAIQRKGLI